MDNQTTKQTMRGNVMRIFEQSRVVDIKRFFDNLKKTAKDLTKVEKICFILNLGKSSKTYLGSDSRNGNHWSVVFLEKGKNIALYGDTLGWECPQEAVQKIKNFSTELWSLPYPLGVQFKVSNVYDVKWYKY